VVSDNAHRRARSFGKDLSFIGKLKIAMNENPPFPPTSNQNSPSSRRRPKHRRCAHCGCQFVVNPRLGKRHRCCARPQCVQARQAAAQKKWRKKWRKEHGGVDYFAGKERREKALAWRARTPGYWKRTRRHQSARPGTLRLTRKLAAALRHVALQDAIDTHLALIIGLISRLSGVALQDAIAREIRATRLRGYAILRGQRIPRTR